MLAAAPANSIQVSAMLTLRPTPNAVCRGTAQTPTVYACNFTRNHVTPIPTVAKFHRQARVLTGNSRVIAPITCSAVVDRPPEFDLHSADLDWPRGFPSRYELGEQLGRGSFGTVYLATDRVSGEEVAAKIIPKERKGTTREHILEKIQQEVCLQMLSPVALQTVSLQPKA